MERHCLSIQSHVVHGYVGNKCAVFPLQLHGFDVSPINSVQLSTHTGYRTVKGQRLDGEALQSLIEGLESNGVLGYTTHILTGYISTESFLRIVAQLVQQVRATNPSAVYVCDPVLGDDGKLYVSADLVPIYRSLVVPLATILTPNQFEAETLTGIKIVDLGSAVRAIRCLHDMGVRIVVVTSTVLRDPHGHDGQHGLSAGSGSAHSHAAATAGQAPDSSPHMLLLASCPWEEVEEECGAGGIFEGRHGLGHAVDHANAGGGASAGLPDAPVPAVQAPEAASPTAIFSIRIPLLPASFTGTGDLTSSLLLANRARYVEDRQAGSSDGGVAAGPASASLPAAHSTAAQTSGQQPLQPNFVRAVESTVASLSHVCHATMARATRLQAELEEAKALLVGATAESGAADADPGGPAPSHYGRCQDHSAAGAGAAATARVDNGHAAARPAASHSRVPLARARALIQSAERGLGRGEDGSVQPFHELALVQSQAWLVNPPIPLELRARAVIV